MESQNHEIESLRREKDELMKLLDNSARYHGSGTFDDTIRKLNEENSALKRKLREKEGEVANLQNMLDKLTREPGTSRVTIRKH